MNLSVGIVGLPNVGKSTLFNALRKAQGKLAQVGNYPFTTIEPNTGVVSVPDERLKRLSEIEKEELKLSNLPPEKHAAVEFIDIAGIVKGASVGEGLGNKFLSHIREVQIIAHVVRAFDPSAGSTSSPQAGSGQELDIVKVGTNPKEDYETINTELILADIVSISKVKDQKSKVQVKGQKEAVDKLFEQLNKGVPARDVELTEDEQEFAKSLFLLSAKPEIVVLNVEETALKDAEQIAKNYAEMLGVSGGNIVVISAKIESELSELSEEDQKSYLEDLGVKESGLERLIKKAYETLGLISFLTAGEIEVKAWTLRRGETALRASGVIHTDFMKDFIKAEIVSYDAFVELGGWKRARELGKSRMEGRDYIMQEGDIVEFKIGR